jgi:hypothetical protein
MKISHLKKFFNVHVFKKDEIHPKMIMAIFTITSPL